MASDDVVVGCTEKTLKKGGRESLGEVKAIKKGNDEAGIMKGGLF